MRIACILTGGPDLEIEVSGVVYRFEMHPQCGPMLLGRRGGIVNDGSSHAGTRSGSG